MPAEDRDEISRVLGVQPIMINAALVSAQIRKRYFWTNIPGVEQPDDRGIVLKKILEKNVPEKYFLSEKILERVILKYVENRTKIHVKEATIKGFAVAVDGDAVDISFPGSTTRRGRVGNKVKTLMTSANIGVFTQGRIRRLTPIECERLQGVTDRYTSQGLHHETSQMIVDISDYQRYAMCGNAFNADVIAHILSFAKW